jgi:hypothetical protein
MVTLTPGLKRHVTFRRGKPPRTHKVSLTVASTDPTYRRHGSAL